MTVLLGNGDGTFTATATSPSTSKYPVSVAIGDFNGDGIPDLAVATSYLWPGVGMYLQTSFTILLGDGKGNFTPTVTIPNTDNGESNIVVGDFNGDGRPDLAAATLSGTITVALAENQFEIATVNGVAPLPVATGTHQVVASYGGDGNYEKSKSSTISLTAAKGAPTIRVTPSANPAPYGAAEILTATVKGSGLTPTGTVTFINGVLLLGTGTLNSSGVATFMSTTLAPGSHTISASYAGDANYTTANSAPFQLTINLGTPTVTVTPSSTSITTAQALTVRVVVSGGSGNPTPTGSVKLTGGGYTSVAATLASGIATINIPAGSLAPGSDTLTASYTPDSNSSSTYNAAKGTSSAVTVTQAKITPTITWAAPAAITYGTALSATQLDASAGSIQGSFVYTPARGTVLTAGTQTLHVTFTPTNKTDYSTATASVRFVVNKAKLTVAANNATRAYGTANPAFIAAFKGFVNGDSAASAVTGKAKFSTTATAKSPVGGYPITVATGTLAAANYSFKFVDGKLTVSKATLTVKANNLSMKAGGTVPPLTYAMTGFVNGDTQTKATTGAPKLTTTATSKSAAGNYPITVAAGSLAATNYGFSYVNGTMTVTK